MKQFSTIPVLILLFLTTALVTSSCKKSKLQNGSSNGITSIAETLTEGNSRTLSLDYSGGSQNLTAITLTSTNNTSVRVKISLDASAVTAAKLMPLPVTSYQFNTMQYDVPAGGTAAVIMALDKTNLRGDTTYGLFLTISEVSAGSISSVAKSMLLKIKVKNTFDGRYKVTGSLVDYTNATYSFAEQEVYVVTTSASQVKIIPVRLGIEGMIIKIGSSDSYYSEVGPLLNIDNTGKVTSLSNFYGQPSPTHGRTLEIDPSGANQWSLTTKSLALKFWVNQPGLISPHRALFNTTWTYLGPR